MSSQEILEWVIWFKLIMCAGGIILGITVLGLVLMSMFRDRS